MTRKISYLLLTLIFLVQSQLSFSQSSNTLRGEIKDSKTGEVLPGAAVRVDGSNRGTVTDLNGIFIIEGIKFSKVTISISYIGYEAKNVEVEFGSRKTVNLNIKLDVVSEKLNEAVVTGKAAGTVKAMLEQKVAVNIKNVVSSEQIMEFPDMNAAEVMQRIPGVTVQRDQGEGKYVQLRGTPPEYTNFNVNGEQIPSPEGNVRYVGMDIIAADQIEFIEITKVLTPDMDADGIAGNVNIITKSAKEGEPEVGVSLAGGYSDLLGTGNQNFQFKYGYRYNKLGFQINSSYNVNNYGSHNMEFDYTRGPTLTQAQSGDTEEENFHVLYDDIEYRHYTITRKRIGLSANLDYELNDNSRIYIRGMYNRFTDDELRRRKSHKLSDANDELTYRSAGMERDVRDRIEIQEIMTVNVGAEHKFFNGLQLDYEGSYADASEKVPNYLSTSFDQGLVSIRVDKTDPTWPTIEFLDESDSINAYNYGSYDFDKLTFRDNKVNDKNYTAKINLKIPYNISNSQFGYIKIGGKTRIKEKERDHSARVYTTYDLYSKNSNYKNPNTQPSQDLSLNVIADDFEEHNLLGHGYELEMIPNADNMRNFYEVNQQYFKLNESDTWEDNNQEDYRATEKIYAGYVMIRHDINNLMILGGVRYERTDIDYTTQNAWLELNKDSTNRGLLKKQEITAKRTIPFVLPQMQIKYSINNKTNIRAAATYTYSRPNFDDILPYRIENEEGDIKKGNPTLKFPLALNFDLLAETYFSQGGLISGGIFYKKIENPVFKYVRRAHEGENFNQFGLHEITMAVNGVEATVFGFEALTQIKFTSLPGILGNLGVFANYTFTESRADISKRYPQNENDVVYTFDDYSSDFFTSSEDQETVPLQGQAKHSGNLALFYEGDKLYMKISSVMHSEFLSRLGNDAGLDVYYEKSLHMDFNANYQFTESLNCFVDLINLTNEPLRYYLGSRDYFKQHEFYSWSGKIGVKLNF